MSQNPNQGPYGQQPPVQYGQPQQPYGAPPPGYSAPQGGYGAPPPLYNPADVIQTPRGMMLLGSRWARLGAAILDGILVGIISIILIGIGSAMAGSTTQTIDVFGTSTTAQVVNRNGVYWAFYLLSILVSLAYYVYFTAQGATLGKRALGLKVINTNGDVPGFGPAGIREGFPVIISLLSNVLPFIGLLALLDIIFILFDPKKQALHDKIANTYVVKAR